MLKFAFHLAWICAALSPGLDGQTLQLRLVTPEVVQSRLAGGVVKQKERAAVLRGLFTEAGCPTPEGAAGKKTLNVVRVLPGEGEGTIVVGGHFDFIDRGQKIVDDWSGTALLPSLYQTLRGVSHQHTFVFVGFAEEERGLIGSTQYVQRLHAEERSKVGAFVNLECLGTGPAKVWVHRSNKVLLQDLLAVARAVKIDVQGVNLEKVGDDDTHPFLSAGIPVISIHSLTQETFPILHSRRDRITAIHADDYYEAYRLVSFYLAFLDGKLNQRAE